MGGGGARAAYQVGSLRYLARRFPDLEVPIVTGVSAGGINAAHFASHHGSFAQAIHELSALWERLTVEDVFRVDTPSLGWIGLRWIFQLMSGGVGGAVSVRGLVDTTPLHSFLSEVPPPLPVALVKRLRSSRTNRNVSHDCTRTSRRFARGLRISAFNAPHHPPPSFRS